MCMLLMILIQLGYFTYLHTCVHAVCAGICMVKESSHYNLFEIHQTFCVLPSDSNDASYDIASKPLRLTGCSIAAILHLYYTTKPHTYVHRI